MSLKKDITDALSQDLIVMSFTHENPPPGKDCSEECGVSMDDQIASANPLSSPVRSGGKKHKKCMECWEEYIDNLNTRIISRVKQEIAQVKNPHVSVTRRQQFEEDRQRILEVLE